MSSSVRVLTLFALAVALPWAAAADTPYELTAPLGLDADDVQVPEDNPLTVEKVELGKLLYFEPRLSVDDTVSCSSCHSPQFGFSDGLPTSAGVRGQRGGRNAPVTINRAVSLFSNAQFWDGRAGSLEEQALGPIQNPIEMGFTLEGAVAKLNKIAGYRTRFQAVFGTDVTADGIAKAIASFERTLLSAGSPLDRYQAGDTAALSASGARGWEIFRSKGKCGSCHAGANFTDELYHNIGVGMDAKEPDAGRYAVTKQEKDRGAFKTPTLRDAALSAPYMHDGSQATLEDVIAFYNSGGVANPTLDKEMHALNLTDQEQQDLVALLEAMTGEPIVVHVPALPQ